MADDQEEFEELAPEVEEEEGEPPAAEEEVEAEEVEPPAAEEEEEPPAEEPADEEPAAADDDPEDEDEEVDEDLKDAVEGSFRLKRLLTGSADSQAAKKRRMDEVDLERSKKVKQLLFKWMLSGDSCVKHVLENLRNEELQKLIDMKYFPPKSDSQQRKTPSEFVSSKVVELWEKALPHGATNDVVSAFRFRHKLDEAAEARLRALTHKDLRYVMENYDGSVDLDEVISESECFQPEEEVALYAMPGGAGPKTIGRFNRLELIDGGSDCAVFGDANLSFSTVLAKHRTGLGHVGRVIATTFEEIETLRERYKEIDDTIRQLEEHDAEVYHGVDCTRIAIDDRFKGMKSTLGAVYYNFPHSGAIPGFFDSHPMVNWRHENLMRLFFRALRSFVKPGGSVKVSSNKGAVGVRFSYIIGSAVENEFVHVETMPFQEWTLHRYGRSYGDRRDSYKRLDAKNNQSYTAQNASNDMVYCFRYAPSGKTLGRQEVRMPPTFETLKNCKDGPFGKLPAGEPRLKLAKDLHQRFLTEVTGTHVG